MARTSIPALLSLALVAGTAAAADDVVMTRDAAIGAKFGAPGPRTCASTKQPTRGALSPAQARAYVICGQEGLYGSGPSLALVSQVHVDIGQGRPFNIVTDSFESIDPHQAVYDIRGSLVSFNCGYTGAASCKRGDQKHGKGICFRTTFGDWRCSFVDMTNDVVHNPLVKPPTLAEAE